MKNNEGMQATKNKLNLSVATASLLPHVDDWVTMPISADSGLEERQDTNQPLVNDSCLYSGDPISMYLISPGQCSAVG